MDKYSFLLFILMLHLYRKQQTSSIINQAKLASFSFRDKSNQILKKIQKRNTFSTATSANPALTSMSYMSNKENMNAEKFLNEPKLFKSKSEYLNNPNLAKNGFVFDPNGSGSSREQNLIKIESMVDLTKDKMNLKTISSVCAFSTKNLFKSCANGGGGTETNSLNPILKNKTMPTLVLNTFPKKNPTTFGEQLKQEFKPHVLHRSQQENDKQGHTSQKNLFGDYIKIKKIIKPTLMDIIKTDVNLMSKSEACIENFYQSAPDRNDYLTSRSSYNFLVNTKDEKTTPESGEKRLLNKITEEKEIIGQSDGSKGLSKIIDPNTQIPSKYSSFTDLTKARMQSMQNMQSSKPKVVEPNSTSRKTEESTSNFGMIDFGMENREESADQILDKQMMCKLTDSSLDITKFINEQLAAAGMSGKMKDVNLDDYFNTILDYNSFNMSSYQMNCISDCYLNEPVPVSMPYQDLNAFVGSATTATAATSNLLGQNLSVGSSGETNSTTTSTVSTNSSSFASTSSSSSSSSSTRSTRGGNNPVLMINEEAVNLTHATNNCIYDSSREFSRNYSINLS